MSSFFAAATAAVWGSSTTTASHDPSDVTSHINPKHATPEEIEHRVDALASALAPTEAAALLRKGGEPGLLPADPDAECAIDRTTLRRWLVAEKLDVASAAARLEKHAHWRADYVPTGRIEPSEVAEELAHDKVFIQPGLDSSGRPVVVISVAKHRKNSDAAALARLKRFICWVFDVAIAKATGVDGSEDGSSGADAADAGDAPPSPEADGRRPTDRPHEREGSIPTRTEPPPDPRRPKPPGDGKLTAIFDLRHATMENMDVAGLKQIFGLLQSHFPERLGRMVFLDPPAIFWGVWRIVSPFVDPVTRAKVVMASTRDLERGDIVPLDVLPSDMGGLASARSVAEAAREHGLLPRGFDVEAAAAEVAGKREGRSGSASASGSPGKAPGAGEGPAAATSGADGAAAAAVLPSAAASASASDDEEGFDDAPSAVDDDEDQDDEAAIAALDEALQRELRVEWDDRARPSSAGGDENVIPCSSSSASAAFAASSSATTASFSDGAGGKVTASVVTTAAAAVVRE